MNETNQPFSNYPRPKPASVDFSVIAEAFRIVFKYPGQFAVASLLALLAMAVPVGIVYVMFFGAIIGMSTIGQPNEAAMFGTMAAFYALIFVASLVGYALAGPSTMSITHMGLKAGSGQTVTMDDVWFGFRQFGHSCLTGLLASLAAFVGVLACIIGLYVTSGLSMLTYAVALDQRLAPGAAVVRSWAMLKPHWLMATLLWFVLAFIAGLGVYACLIGVVFSWPILYVGAALVYRDLRQAEVSLPGGMGAPGPGGQ